MKKIYTVFLMVFLPICGLLAQSNEDTRIQQNTTTSAFSQVSQRIGVDFEIKNNPQVALTVLEQINLNVIEQQRQLNTRVELVDVATGLTIIVYSVNETTQNKANILFGGTDQTHSQTEENEKE